MTSWLVSSLVATGDPALPGNHPLTQAQAGSVLISELRCAACHSGFVRGSLPEKTAPNLTDVGAKVSPEYLRQFLAVPSSAHPGTTMPDVLVSKTEKERDTIAEALSHFLIAQSRGVFHAEVTENEKENETSASLCARFTIATQVRG